LGCGYIAIEMLDDIAKQIMNNLRIESLLVADMVVNGCLVYPGAIRDFVNPGSGKTGLGKFFCGAGRAGLSMLKAA
jgi:hypothetical protein